MMFYITVNCGAPTCYKTFEAAFASTKDSKDWFVCSCFHGNVVVCGHSMGAMDDRNNRCILARLKRHFAKRDGLV